MPHALSVPQPYLSCPAAAKHPSLQRVFSPLSNGLATPSERRPSALLAACSTLLTTCCTLLTSDSPLGRQRLMVIAHSYGAPAAMHLLKTEPAVSIQCTTTLHGADSEVSQQCATTILYYRVHTGMSRSFHTRLNVHSNNSLVTTHYALLTTHYPLPTTHYSLPTTHYSPLTTSHYYSLLLATHYSLLTTTTAHC